MRETEKPSYVISLKRAPVMKQMKGLEMTIRTDLYNEKIMIVLRACRAQRGVRASARAKRTNHCMRK